MAVDRTLAQLVGSLSTATIRSKASIGDVQEASPPAVSAVFAASLGEKGSTVTVEGLMRFSDSTLSAAVNAINAQETTLTELRKAGTTINAFTGSTVFEDLHPTVTNCYVSSFSVIGKRTKSTSGANTVVSQPYRLILRKLR